MRDEGWLDVQGAPFTSSAKITEKFRRPSYGRIEIDVTIDDPKAYTKPWTVRVNWRLAADEDLIEFICSGEQCRREVPEIALGVKKIANR